MRLLFPYIRKEAFRTTWYILHTCNNYIQFGNVQTPAHGSVRRNLYLPNASFGQAKILFFRSTILSNDTRQISWLSFGITSEGIRALWLDRSSLEYRVYRASGSRTVAQRGNTAVLVAPWNKVAPTTNQGADVGGPREICLPLNIAFAPSTWVALSLSLAARWPRGILILRGVAAFALLRPPSRSNRCCLLSSSSSSSSSIFSSFVVIFFFFFSSFSSSSPSLCLPFLYVCVILEDRDEDSSGKKRFQGKESGSQRWIGVIIGKGNERYCYAVINSMRNPKANPWRAEIGASWTETVMIGVRSRFPSWFIEASQATRLRVDLVFHGEIKVD